MPRAVAGDDVAPLAKAGHVGVVGRGAQAGGFDGGGHGPKALARHQRRGGLDDGIAAGGQVLCKQGVKALGVELADREVGRVWEVHHDDVKHVTTALQPLEGIGVDDVHLGVVQRVGVEPHQRGVGLEQLGHGRVQLHQGDAFYAGVFQNLAHRHAIAPAQHGHTPGCAKGSHGGMHQGLVVAVFVAFRKLQVAVQKQAVAAFACGDHNALVGRGSGDHRGFVVKLVFCQRCDVLGPSHASCQRCQRECAGPGMRAQARHGVPKHPQCPHGHGSVKQAEEQAGAYQPQLRHQHQRKGHRHRQRTQVVKGQHLRHQFFEHHLAFEYAHHQRDLQPHQNADQHHHQVQQKSKGLWRVGMGQEQ